MIAAALCTAAVAAFGAWAMHGKAHAPPPVEPDFTEIENVCREIGKLQAQLDEIDRMLTDIEICKPDELMKSFRCQWQSGGKARQHDFYIDGTSPTSESMRRMVTAERERLRTSLLLHIDELSRLRCNTNVVKTEEETEGEWYHGRR